MADPLSFLWTISPEDHAAALSAWSALLSAVSSIALTFLTFWLAYLTAVLAKETRRTREANERADIQCSVEPHEAHIINLELVIANVGKGSARDVQILLDASSRGCINGKEPKEPLKLNFSTVLPGAVYRLYLGSYPDLRDRLIKIAVKFTDDFGPHTLPFTQDVSGWEGFRRSSKPPSYSMAASLEELTKTVSGWSGSARLKVDSFTHADRVREREELERYWADLEAQSSNEPSGPSSSAPS